MEMEKSYDPAAIEDKNYSLWMDNGYYRSDPQGDKEPFSIVIPPPNVTGSLHIGHALNNTLQDMIVRYKRMSGFDVLWVPGMDHAGIATQMVVERELDKEKTDRRSLGRERFVEKVWQWKENSGGQIINQLKKLGALPDWDRERFTLDAGLSGSVIKAFVDLYNEGLIYKDKRLVNWDPKLCTAISDLEVQQLEEKGSYWYIKYPLEGEKDRYLTVATTRPETMLGDTAVAVHPDDERYKDLVGKQVVLPIVNRKIPIIADEYSDPKKGSGAVKITPAHDFNDFEVGKRHDLEMINILDQEARLNSNVPAKYIGLSRYKAREEIIKDLNKLQLIAKVEDTVHTVPYGDRSEVAVEPWLTDQWYVDTREMASRAIKAVENNEIRFYPKYWENTYFEWMRNIEPWCISRQLWWGHRIPAWYGPDGKIFVERTEEEAVASARVHYGKKVELKRDEDVLDTWFSSGLWPFSTLGWPESTDDLKKYYPTSCLVTGFDIIFFWVARMIMMGLKFTKKVPFRDVYIHGLIRDETGQKMSKTKGNAIDPLQVIDKYGADSIRFSLTALASQGNDINLALPVIEGYRNFMNKIWNAFRFVTLNLDVERSYDLNVDPALLKTTDKWILSRLNGAVKEVRSYYSGHEYDKVAHTIYHFIWNDYCDWYIEFSKQYLYGDDPEKKENTQTVLLKVLYDSIKLLHPISPFVTEELYQILKSYKITPAGKDSVLLDSYPEYSDKYVFEKEHEEIEYVKDIVVCIRNMRANIGLHPSSQVTIKFHPGNDSIKEIISLNAEVICSQAKVSDHKFIKADEEVKKMIRAVIPGTEIYLSVDGSIDVEEEIKRLRKSLEKLNVSIDKASKKLKNREFLKKAPEDVIEKEKNKVDEYTFQIDKIESALENLEKIN